MGLINHRLILLLPQWRFKVRNVAAVRNCHHNVFYSCFISLQVHFRNPSWVLVKMIMILWPLSKYLFKIINKNSLIIMNDSSYITSICDIWRLFFSFFTFRGPVPSTNKLCFKVYKYYKLIPCNADKLSLQFQHQPPLNRFPQQPWKPVSDSVCKSKSPYFYSILNVLKC